jgi:hypothetical protein
VAYVIFLCFLCDVNAVLNIKHETNGFFCLKHRSGRPSSLELAYVTDVKVTYSFLKRWSKRLRICTSLLWQQEQDLNRNPAMSTWRPLPGNYRNNVRVVMNEIIWETQPHHSGWQCRTLNKTSLGGLPWKLWRNSYSGTPEAVSNCFNLRLMLN